MIRIRVSKLVLPFPKKNQLGSTTPCLAGCFTSYVCTVQVCSHEWRPVDKKNIAVNSLVFHSSEPTWLFCGTNDGVVSLWDVGTPSLPTYDSTNPKQLLKLYPDYGTLDMIQLRVVTDITIVSLLVCCYR